MGNGEKSLLNKHLQLPHHQGKKQQETRDVPKGCLAIKVGQGEEQQRFVVPVIYFNHPLFVQLLKEAEEEYGFDQKGTIAIPCHVEEFRYVQVVENDEADNGDDDLMMMTTITTTILVFFFFVILLDS
ncbi:hypothetical protein F0562_019393 [Nyssa sinensis]|uniref:Uncharacterized protein n=1 Tax=Nyssa sinensis TaxID=561372 RepID=A0A5J4ZEH0_9ASTE|nr:hypothetical protein F0562_019393 [Nyssa sinensis]